MRPNQSRAKNAMMLIWIVLVLEIASLASGYLQYVFIKSAANGSEISMEAANANDTREQIIGFVSLIAFVISMVTFIQWFRRAYFNLHQKVDYLANSEGWAAGCWFVPILNLFKPYQIMKELYVETKSILAKNGIAIQSTLSTNSLGLWWTLWILNGILGNIVFRLSLRAESIDAFITSTLSGMIYNVISIALALITIKVINDYSKVEPLLLEIREEEPVSQPAQ